MTRGMQLAVVGLSLSLAATAYAQRTVYVNAATGNDAWDGLCEVWNGSTCGPKATIKAGIDVAVNGDQVRVADGLYIGAKNRNLDFWGKAIRVHSASGDPNACVIDCQQSGRGFRFHSGETAASVVRGFTIRNGSVEDYGGGIYCGNASSPTITACVLKNNSSDAHGGGIACISASTPTLADCTITDNTTAAFGGGMYCRLAHPALDNCTITGNTSTSSGAGAYCEESSPTLSDCTISGNTSHYYGGGIYCGYSSSPTLAGCTIAGNTADQTAGGICCEAGSSPTLTDCAITGNTSYVTGGIRCVGGCSPTLARCDITANRSYYQGGGVHCLSSSSPTLVACTLRANTTAIDGGAIYCQDHSTPTLVNCVLVGNTANEDGGAVTCHNSDPTFVNCTFSANVAARWGGAVYCTFDSSPTFDNCIPWNDYPEEIGLSTGNPVVTYTDIEGWWPVGEGNINVDPLFVRPPTDGGDGWGDDPNTPGIDEGANDDFGDLRLQPGSPCIDAADNTAVPPDTLDLDGDGNTTEPVPFDLAGLPRFVDDAATPDTGVGPPPVVDMGAYEFYRVGDLNCDGVVSFADINPFVLALGGYEGYHAAYPNCNWLHGDCNGDGTVNFADINPFVALLSGS